MHFHEKNKSGWVSFHSIVYVCAGYANPRFLRSTMYNVPCTSDMLKASHIPFALSVTPFARLGSQEVGVYFVAITLFSF